MNTSLPPSYTVFLCGESVPVFELAGQLQSCSIPVICNVADGALPAALGSGVRLVHDVPADFSIACELTNIDIEQKRANLTAIESVTRGSRTILSAAVTITTGEQSSWLSHPDQLAGICALPTLLSRSLIEISPSRFTSPSAIASVRDLAAGCGKEVAFVEDRIGMVMPRILCQIINEAFFAVMEGVATPADIDIAMKLGTNYPFGPFEWGEKIGLKNVLATLEALHANLGEDRYRVAPLLREMAHSGIWWGSK